MLRLGSPYDHRSSRRPSRGSNSLCTCLVVAFAEPRERLLVRHSHCPGREPSSYERLLTPLSSEGCLALQDFALQHWRMYVQNSGYLLLLHHKFAEVFCRMLTMAVCAHLKKIPEFSSYDAAHCDCLFCFLCVRTIQNTFIGTTRCQPISIIHAHIGCSCGPFSPHQTVYDILSCPYIYSAKQIMIDMQLKCRRCDMWQPAPQWSSQHQGHLKCATGVYHKVLANLADTVSVAQEMQTTVFTKF